MKVKLPKPFYTARVGEALSSLTNYVSEAHRVANEITPALFADSQLKLEAGAVPLGPKLLRGESIKKSEEVGELKKRKIIEDEEIDAITRGRHKGFLFIVVHGHHLENVESFALIPADNLSDESWSTDDVYIFKHFLVAVVKRKTGAPVLPPPGKYHAWAQDSFGQEDLLLDAFEI